MQRKVNASKLVLDKPDNYKVEDDIFEYSDDQGISLRCQGKVKCVEFMENEIQEQVNKANPSTFTFT